MKDKKYPLKEEFDYYGKARINIDYSHEKPQIKFEAPEKEKKTRISKILSGIILIIMLSAIFFALIYWVISLGGSLGHVTDIKNTYTFYPDSKNSTAVNTTIFFDDGTNFSYYSSIMVSRFSFIVKANAVQGGMYNSLNDKESLIIIALISCILGSIAFFFLNKSSGGNTTKFKPLHWMQFKPEDLEEYSCGDLDNKGKWMAKVSIFENDVIEFDTEGEFNDYLEGIKINEYPVYQLKKKWNKVKETKKKDYGFWHAEFIFSQKPTTGWIKMRFK